MGNVVLSTWYLVLSTWYSVLKTCCAAITARFFSLSPCLPFSLSPRLPFSLSPRLPFSSSPPLPFSPARRLVVTGWPFLVCFYVTLAGCAGYQVGNQSLFRPDIRTVHVPMFESDSLRRNLGERLTEAVAKEIERQSTYKVVYDPAMADSILTGRIVADRKGVVAENINDEPRAIEVDWAVQVSWIDRRGESVMPTSSFSLAQQGFMVDQVAVFVPEAGQSIATAHQEAISRIAKQIVSQMEAAW